jgi:hypothetical protein
MEAQSRKLDVRSTQKNASGRRIRDIARNLRITFGIHFPSMSMLKAISLWKRFDAQTHIM